MDLFDIFRCRKKIYIPDLLTAWIARAMKNTQPVPEKANFKTADGLLLRTADGYTFNVKEAS